MIQVPPQVVRGWHVHPPRIATDADIAMLEAAFGGRLPTSYVAFVQSQGFVNFGYDPQQTRVFTYSRSTGAQRELRQGYVGFLAVPERALQTWRTFTDKSDPDAEDLPLIPDGFFPAGNDLAQGLILIELSTGKIWYWPESAWRWGTEDNLHLGFVADDFDDFINGLRPDVT